jgi:TatD DNase family protein
VWGSKMIFDTHCHLNNGKMYGKYRDFLREAKLVGVSKFVIIGYDLESSIKAVKIAETEPDVCYAAVGVHPNEILNQPSDCLAKLEELLTKKCVVAVGEIGLDYHWKKTPKADQKVWFERQIELAYKFKKPIVIHSRDASEDTYKILKKNQEKIIRGVIHCYSGSKEMVKLYEDLNMYISFAGPITFKNARTPKEALLTVSPERLIFETDSPYLAPHPFRGQENKPSNITLIIKEAATLLGKDYITLAKESYKNALALFGISDED